MSCRTHHIGIFLLPCGYISPSALPPAPSFLVKNISSFHVSLTCCILQQGISSLCTIPVIRLSHSSCGVSWCPPDGACHLGVISNCTALRLCILVINENVQLHASQDSAWKNPTVTTCHLKFPFWFQFMILKEEISALFCPAHPQRSHLLWFYPSGFESAFLYTSMYLLEMNAYVLVGKPAQADFLQSFHIRSVLPRNFSFNL